MTGSPDAADLRGRLAIGLRAAAGISTLIGQSQAGLNRFAVVESRDVEIKGATTGRLTRYTILDDTGSHLSG